MKKKIFICDVDNCISDDEHRMHRMPLAARIYAKTGAETLVDQKPRSELTDADFHQYHLHCIFDAPHNLSQLWLHGIPDEIWMVTAMPQPYSYLRWWWFHHHLPPLARGRIQLIMRPSGDHSPSHELKVRLLSDKFTMSHRDPREVIMAIDDRQDVLDAYEEHFNFPTKRVFIND